MSGESRPDVIVVDGEPSAPASVPLSADLLVRINPAELRRLQELAGGGFRWFFWQSDADVLALLLCELKLLAGKRAGYKRQLASKDQTIAALNAKCQHAEQRYHAEREKRRAAKMAMAQANLAINHTALHAAQPVSAPAPLVPPVAKVVD
jgi:outer membrane murein-binding lipoprotein Lpp